MLEPILGSLVREQVLLYIHARGRGYSRAIARFFKSPVDSVQKQLKRLERDRVLVSEPAGRTVLYTFNSRYPFLSELRALMERLLQECTEEYGDIRSGVTGTEARHRSRVLLGRR